MNIILRCRFLLTLALYILGIQIGVLHASAHNLEADIGPSQYVVLQQQGPVCPFIPWLNLTRVEEMRRRGSGVINLEH